jgi:glycosyltransferase involved in cell wall biosynthesis
MKKMKVLLFHDVFEHIGGAETYVFGIEKELMKKIDLYTFYQSFDTEKKEIKNIVYKNGKYSKIGKFISYHLRDFRFHDSFKKTLDRIKPEIIHINHNNLHYFDVLRAAKGYKIIQTIHDYGIVCPRTWAINKKGKICTIGPSLKCFISGCTKRKEIVTLPSLKLKNKLIKERINLILAPSKKLKEILKERGFGNVKVLNYFIDLTEWKKINKKDVFRKKIKNLLYVGGLTKQKGVHVLIKAISKLPKEILNEIHLQIVGKGEFKFELERLIKKENLTDHVQFLGYKSGEELKQLYKEAYALVVPSIWLEQFGLIGLEAMASSTPVIGSNLGGIPEWLKDNQTGRLFKPGDSEDLNQKLLFLINSPKTAELYGKQGREMVEKNFSKEKHINQLIKIYQNLKNGK